MDVQATSWQWYTLRDGESRLRGLRVERADDMKLWTIQRFREAAQGFDVVVCDGPPQLGKVTTAAAICADVVVIPLRAAHPDMWAVIQTKALLDEADTLREQLGLPPARRVAVLNEVRPREKETSAMQQALEPLAMELLHVAHRVAYDRARGEGEAVITHGDDKAARKEMNALYDVVVEQAALAEKGRAA